MEVQIKEFRRKDHKKAIEFAAKGMHFDIYFYENQDKFLNLYSKYFWYSELLNATQVIAAYIGDEFVGVLLAEIYGEKKQYKSFTKLIYVKIIEFVQRHIVKKSANMYECAKEIPLKCFLYNKVVEE